MTTYFRSVLVRLAGLAAALVIALVAGLVAGPSGSRLTPGGLAGAPRVHASTCPIQCCQPALIRIHTNATLGDEFGPLVAWRKTASSGDFVPVNFKVVYRRCAQVGSQTIEFSGELLSNGTLRFTPPSGYTPVLPCAGNGVVLPAAIVELHDRATAFFSDLPCMTGGRDGVRTGASTCFSDTDWVLRAARRISGPPSGGSMMGTLWEFTAVVARIDVGADAFLQTDEPVEDPSTDTDLADCGTATDRSLVSHHWRTSQQTVPGAGNEVYCWDGDPFSGANGEVPLCLYAAFTP